MRNRYTSDTYHSSQNSQKSGSPTNSYENVISDQIMASQAEGNNRSNQIFVDTPFASYKGHTSDLLDVSWSKVCNLLKNRRMIICNGIWQDNRLRQRSNYLITCLIYLIRITELFHSHLLDGQNCTTMAYFSEGMPMLFPTYRFCYSYIISSKKRPILFVWKVRSS